MSLYFDVLKKYADFSGRARRKEFWTFALINVLIVLILFTIAMLLQQAGGSNGNASPGFTFMMIVVMVFDLAILLPSLAVEVRRLHDIGKSGWWWFIQLVPIIGGIWLLVLFLLDSQPGSNQWGPNPKAVGAATPSASRA